MIYKRDTKRILARAEITADAMDGIRKLAMWDYIELHKPVLGAWTNIGTLAAGGTETIVNDHVYVAPTDGTVVAFGEAYSSAPMVIKTDSANPPTTTRGSYYTASSSYMNGQLTSKVKKGDYWKTENATTIFWIPTLNT